MSHPIDNLGVHPVFYDALTGPFQPEIDVRAHTHTLGRLAYGTVERGVQQEQDGEQVLFGYEPTWAPNVTSTAICSVDLDTGILSLTGLALAHTSDVELAVHQTRLAASNTSTPADHIGVAIEDGVSEQTLYKDFEFGGAPRVAEKVSWSAKAFFSLAHSLNSSE